MSKEEINAYLEARVWRQGSDRTDANGKERPGMYNRLDMNFKIAMEVL